MALTNLVTSLVLDVYDHDTTPTSVKAIALDKQTRFIKATLTYRGADYPVDENATVTLTVIRPDKTGVQVTGSVVDVDNADRTGTIKGVFAELSQAALAVSGNLKAQFMVSVGDQILRTEIFSIKNGEALDADVSEWAGEYQGYNLDELVQSVNSAVATVTEMETDVSDLKEGFKNANANIFETVARLNVPLANAAFNWKLDGTGKAVSATGFKLLKIEVVEGTSIWIKASADSEGVYQFQNSKSVPASLPNNGLIGTPQTTAIDGLVIVPSGATWLIISATSDNAVSGVYTYKTKYDNIDLLTKTVGIYASTFQTQAGSTHSSNSDQIVVDIPQGNKFQSTLVTDGSFDTQFWIWYSDGTSKNLGTVASNTAKAYYAEQEIVKIGAYIGPQSLDHACTLVIKTNISLSADESVTASEVLTNTFNSAYTDASLDTKIKEFCALFVGGEDIEPFLFFTDPHYFVSGDHFSDASKKNFEKYMPVIQKAYNSTPVGFCLCGGDWLTDSDTPSEACAKLGYMDGITRDFFKVYYPIIGNHDTNYQGLDDGTIPKQLSNQTITNLMFRDFGKNYYTFKTQVSRFYVFDSGTDWETGMSEYRWEQVDWYAKQLKQNDDTHSVVGIHIVTNQTKDAFEESPVIQAFANNLTLVAQAYNNRQSITLNSITYDFTSATGKAEFVISGHTHWDGITTVNGIPTMMTEEAYSGSIATFDLVYADYTNRVVKTVRVGTGENRTMALT